MVLSNPISAVHTLSPFTHAPTVYMRSCSEAQASPLGSHSDHPSAPDRAELQTSPALPNNHLLPLNNQGFLCPILGDP